MAEHNERGNNGERIAAEFLQKKGYVIKHQNWHYMQYELDIVAEKDDQLVVVEVKTRSTETFGNPFEAVTNKKIRNIVAATEAYIMMYDIMKETRFDVISIVLEKGSFKIEHIEDAFLAPVN